MKIFKYINNLKNIFLMHQPIEIYIGLRYLSKNSMNDFYRFISWFSAISIMVGVTAVITITSIVNGFEQELKNNIINHQPQALITSNKGWINPNKIICNQILSSKNIKDIKQLNTCELILQSSQNISTGTMFGIHQENVQSFISDFTKNNLNVLIKSGEYKTIISQALAQQLNVKKYDTIRLIVPNIYQNTLIGKIPRQRLFTIVDIYNTNDKLNKHQLLINHIDASKLMGYPSKSCTGLQVYFNNPLTISNFTKNQLPEGIIYQNWYDNNKNIFQAINMEKNMMTLLIILMIIISSSNIITSVSMLILEKKTDIAILQIQGCTHTQIMIILITYGISTGIISLICGTISGIFLAKNINKIINILNKLNINNEQIPVHVDIIQIIMIIMFITIIILLSVIYPAWKGINTNKIKKLNYE